MFLKTLFGLQLDETELEIFRACTGRSAPPPTGYSEATLICGRRAGKSLVLALIATYLAVFRDYRPFLTAGERGTIMIIAADRKQAQSIFRYLKGFLGVKTLAGLIERETAEVLELRGQVSIEVQTASFRTLRGRTVVASLNDELGFWRTDDGASPDTEIFAALRPACATIPGAMMFKASSPYAQKGVLYDDHKRYFGNDDAPVLVWKASTKTMNPSISDAFLAEEMERDPASFASEYLAEFRAGISEWLSREVIESAIDTDIVVRPPNLMLNNYVAFCDSAGGGGKDSFTLAISHVEADTVFLDHLTEIKPPFAASEAVAQISKMLKLYGLSECSGDRWAGGVIADLFASNGITYRPSTRDRSAIYVDALPLFSSGKIKLWICRASQINWQDLSAGRGQRDATNRSCSRPARRPCERGLRCIDARDGETQDSATVVRQRRQPAKSAQPAAGRRILRGTRAVRSIRHDQARQPRLYFRLNQNPTPHRRQPTQGTGTRINPTQPTRRI